jgi:isoquinoline 1-oxidoreductase subunit beta
MSVITRREFVNATAATVGGLALSLELPAQETAKPLAASGPKPPRAPSAFLQIGEDDGITIVTPAVEMGQGGHSALPMLIMEELGGNWQRVVIADAPAAAIYNNPMFGLQATVGSFSVRGWYNELRRIGAAARVMLLQAAAQTWKVSAHDCTVDNSLVIHSASGRSCSFGKVARLAANMPVPQDPVLKTVAQYTVIGSAPPRPDVPAKTDGSARYGIDMLLPDMLYAAVVVCPTHGGKLKSFDDSASKTMPGYHSTVATDDGVIILAQSYWKARKALERVQADYDLGPLAGLDSAKISEQLRSGFGEPGTVARNDGDVETALASAAKRVEAVYEVPYLAHACMEPMNCTARVTPTGCDVWCGTQNPQAAQQAAAKASGLPPDKVNVHVQYLGGGFGRRGEGDFVTQAVLAAKTTNGRPVKLIWSREEDIQHDFYRPAAAIRFRGGLDASGKLIALDCKVVTAAAPSFGRPGPPFYTEAVADATYLIPNFRVTGLNRDVGIRFGFWRSVNHSHNPFMFEGFIDEMARAAGRDPYEFRRSMLQHDKEAARRQLAVLDLMAEKADWKHPKAGHAFGIAAFEAFGSFIGTIVEVSMHGNVVNVQRVVQAIDCGIAVHPENIKAQMEGGMVYGLTAALRGKITIQNGAIVQTNFNDYPMLGLLEMPRVESYIVPSTAAPGGVGEPGTGPIAPALGNAIYAASGQRLRQLPLSESPLTYKAMRV